MLKYVTTILFTLYIVYSDITQHSTQYQLVSKSTRPFYTSIILLYYSTILCTIVHISICTCCTVVDGVITVIPNGHCGQTEDKPPW